MSKLALKVENLNVTLDGNHIIKNMSFEVEKGEVLVILGRNGAGKTTLLKAILGLVPYTGSVVWDTENISYLPPQEFVTRRNLPPLTISEFFKFKTDSQSKVSKILDKVGLEEEFLDREFTKLSTGQFQRMIIAWALVDDPDMLILDEATAGIDIGGQETIYTLLHNFWKERVMTMIFVTHDLSIVWEHANKVLCVNKKKVCYGKPRNILSPDLLKKVYGTGIKYYEHKRV